MKTGRPPKSTETLKILGTYREDRHAGRADVVPPAGTPIKPDSLDGDAGRLWDQIVPDLVRRKLVGESDTAELVSLCEMWGLYRAAYQLAKVDPVDKEIRCAVTGYWGAFNRAATSFGLSPVARASMKIQATETPKGISTRNRA